MSPPRSRSPREPIVGSILRTVMAAIGIVVSSLFTVEGQEQKKPASNSTEIPKRGFLGLEHERLRGLVGKWYVPLLPRPVKGTVEFQSITGGRFVTEVAEIPY